MHVYIYITLTFAFGPRARIAGAKKVCMDMKDTHVRCASLMDRSRMFINTFMHSNPLLQMIFHSLLRVCHIVWYGPRAQEEQVWRRGGVLCGHQRARTAWRVGNAGRDQKKDFKTWGLKWMAWNENAVLIFDKRMFIKLIWMILKKPLHAPQLRLPELEIWCIAKIFTTVVPVFSKPRRLFAGIRGTEDCIRCFCWLGSPEADGGRWEQATRTGFRQQPAIGGRHICLKYKPCQEYSHDKLLNIEPYTHVEILFDRPV